MLSLEARPQPYRQEGGSITVQAASPESSTGSVPAPRHREVSEDTAKTSIQAEGQCITDLFMSHGSTCDEVCGGSTGTREACFKSGEFVQSKGTVRGRKQQVLKQQK